MCICIIQFLLQFILKSISNFVFANMFKSLLSFKIAVFFFEMKKYDFSIRKMKIWLIVSRDSG